MRRLRHFSWSFFAAALALSTLGLVFIHSATAPGGGGFVARQATWFALGLGVFAAAILLDYRVWERGSYAVYGAVTVLLVLVLLMGKARLGAQRWLSVGGFALQPSEFSKLALIMVLARYLSLNVEHRKRLWYLPGALAITVLPLALILKQPDLGTALVYVPILVGMVFVAGVRMRDLVILGLSGVACLPLLWNALRQYQKERLVVFLNPDVDPLGSGYNIIQSKIAVGSGGLLGAGWMQGSQSQLRFIPERHTDFVFAVMAEEWGFAGSVLVLLLFGLLFISGLYVAQQAKDLFGRLLVTGFVVMVACHFVVNVGMTIGFMPITGLPLPWVSYGGSAMLAFWFGLGLVENVYARRFVFH